MTVCAEIKICKTSGLEIERRTEWENIALSDVCRVDFELIGERIFHSTLKGEVGVRELTRFLEVINRIIGQFDVGKDCSHCLINQIYSYYSLH